MKLHFLSRYSCASAAIGSLLFQQSASVLNITIENEWALFSCSAWLPVTLLPVNPVLVGHPGGGLATLDFFLYYI